MRFPSLRFMVVGRWLYLMRREFFLSFSFFFFLLMRGMENEWEDLVMFIASEGRSEVGNTSFFGVGCEVSVVGMVHGYSDSTR